MGLLTNKELSEELKVTNMCLYKWRKQGMPFIQRGKGAKLYYELESVKEWLKNQK